MGRRRRRALYYLTLIHGLILLYTLVYMWGMEALENRPRSFPEALLVVVQTFTTVGFGEDAPWQTTEMELLMVSMMATGVFVIFMALPLFIAPWIEERLSTTPPAGEVDLTDHVVICSYTSRGQKLTEELDILNIPYVVVVPDRDRAVELFESNVPVLHGDPETQQTLENARISDAQAVVVDIDDETNPSVALTANQLAPDTTLITFVKDPDLAAYHEYAGADYVFSPRTLIGESLAEKVTRGITANVGDAIEIGEDFEIAELPVQYGSELTDKTVAESGIRERTGANVIGAWFRGEFVSPPSPDARIDEQTILLVAGQEDQLETLKELTLSETRPKGGGNVVIGGYGEVGSTIESILETAGISSVTIDTEERNGVDFVGDMTDQDDLREAGVDDASTVILALPDDTMTIFATLVVRELNPEVEIIARADETESVRKLYQAGADYVLALATVSGRMLASTILGEDVISLDQQVEVIRFDANGLAGQTLAGADIRAQTGCTVIAIERNGDVFTDFDPDFEFATDDSLVVAGPDESIAMFAKQYE
ncbi:potassium channel family protein [Halorientalis brevis]|uniref:Potassium channel family protein n=1 Tax=Halorientalis brevis TaxID=1126241 RepID=A0ABD6CDY9_9EURY|nr:NAD-binding protein [Halorientalis brevis]